MLDVWRELYPEKRRYSWRKFNTTKQGRLDYFLISDEDMSEINCALVESIYRSDHSAVLLSFETEAFKRDKPFWKFNNSLFQDKKYIEEINLMLKVKTKCIACTQF